MLPKLLKVLLFKASRNLPKIAMKSIKNTIENMSIIFDYDTLNA